MRARVMARTHTMNLFSYYNARFVSPLLTRDRRVIKHVVECDRRLALCDRRVKHPARMLHATRETLHAARVRLALSYAGLTASMLAALAYIAS